MIVRERCHGRLLTCHAFILLSQTTSKRTKMIRELISEVVGMSPYERRLLDMLKTGGASSEKRMYKFAKRRVSFTLFMLDLS